MNLNLRWMVTLALGGVLAPMASAQCGMSLTKPMAGAKAMYKPAALLLPIGQDSDNFGRDRNEDGLEAIVGLWKVQFVAKDSPGLPDGFLVDHGYSAWHSDFTEFLNSSRTPPTGNFCLGVWKKVGRATYKLNHFALAYDATGQNPVGTVNIREQVTVDWSHNCFKGTFTIDAYDVNGTHYPSTAPGNHAQGVITGERVTIETRVD